METQSQFLGRSKGNYDGMRLAIILCLAFFCPDTLGFDSSHLLLRFQRDQRLIRAASVATTGPGHGCKIKRRTPPNGASSSSPLYGTSLTPPTSTLAWNEDDSSDASTSWDDVLSPQPPLSLSTSQASHPFNKHNAVTSYDKALLASFTGLAAAAVGILLACSAPGAWRYFLAGGICAATSHAIPTPIDVVKTRKQVDASLADKPFLSAAKTIVKEEGFRALWAGLGPTYWGYLVEGAIKFGVYEILKPIVKSGLTRIASTAPSSLAVLNCQWLAFMMCAIVSGLSASFVLCPMEALRIRMVAEPSFAKEGWIHGGYRILKEEGVTGLAKGMNAMIFKQVPYTVTKNVSFDILARFFYSLLRSSGAAISGTVSFGIPLLAAATASVLSSITSQPGDMVLSLVNAHGGEKTSRDFVRNILQSERGISGFFVGFKTRLLHVGITVTIQLVIYDYVKRLCGVAATGSL